MDRYINEMETFVEDLQFQRSYQIEPKEDSFGNPVVPVVNSNCLSGAVKSAHGSVDLLSLPNEASGDAPVAESRDSDSLGSRPTSRQFTYDSNQEGDNPSLRNGRPKKLHRRSMVERSGDHSRRQSETTPVSPAESPSSPRRAWALFSGRKKSHSSVTASSVTASSVLEAASEMAWKELFDDTLVMKEGLLIQKMKRNTQGKKPSHRQWQEHWVRLFPGAIIFLPKRPRKSLERDQKVDTSIRC